MALHRCCGPARCAPGILDVASAFPSDAVGDAPFEFPIAITRAVGRGNRQVAPNLPDDVRTIQEALNHLSPAVGGASPALEVDGLVGRFTLSAIEAFQKRQFGTADARVDPDRQTIERINTLALALFVTVSPRIIHRIYSQLLPDVHRCLVAAEDAVVTAAKAAASPGRAPPNPARALVDRHFHLDRHPRPAVALAFIQRIVRKMLAVASRNLGAERTFVAAPGRFDLAKSLVSGVLAMALPNGIAQRGSFKGRAQDGSDVMIPNDKILIMLPFARATRDLQITTLLHELAHFVGGPEGSSDLIDDPPSRSSAPAEIAKLPVVRMPFIAENYGTFAFEAAFRRPAFKILI